MGGGGAGSPESAKKKALRATASDGDGASAPVPPVEQQQKQQPAPLPAAGVVASSAAVHQSCGGEDDQDDEQVERFYALLANIRALRGLYSAGTGPASPGRSSRKRAREAEPPWTPAFRLEDFEVEEDVNQGASGGVATRPAATMFRRRSGSRK